MPNPAKRHRREWRCGREGGAWPASIALSNQRTIALEQIGITICARSTRYMADWITTREASELTGYTIQRVAQLVRAGTVKGRRFGTVWQVSRRSLLAYHRQAEQAGEKRGPKTAT